MSAKPNKRELHDDGSPYGSDPSRSKSLLVILIAAYLFWFAFLVGMAVLRLRGT